MRRPFYTATFVVTLSTAVVLAQPAPVSANSLESLSSALSSFSRSLDDCRALPAVGLTVYLPAGLSAPAGLHAAEELCGLKIASLPRRIENPSDVLPSDLPAPGLLYLPHPYIDADADSAANYLVVLGLGAAGYAVQARQIVDNALFAVEHYGAALASNRTADLVHPQPPLLTTMIRAVYENHASFAATPQGRIAAREWLRRAYQLAQMDYLIWTRPELKAGTTGLTRDSSNGPAATIAPLRLNSLLFRYERDLSHFAHLLALPTDAARWQKRASARNVNLHRYLWNQKVNLFNDFDFSHAKASGAVSIATLYPLWAGLATQEEAQSIAAQLDRLAPPAAQDQPYGWAAEYWFAIAGLETAGLHTQAAQMAQTLLSSPNDRSASDPQSPATVAFSLKLRELTRLRSTPSAR